MKRTLVWFATLIALTGCSNTAEQTTPTIDTPTSQAEPLQDQAQERCKDRVTSQLVAPGAFSGVTTAASGANTWDVTGTVRGQREQDETARNLQWTCTATYSPTTKGFKTDGAFTTPSIRTNRLPAVAAMCADLKEVFTFGGGDDAAEKFYATIQGSNTPAPGTGLKFSDLTQSEKDSLRLAIYQAANNRC